MTVTFCACKPAQPVLSLRTLCDLLADQLHPSDQAPQQVQIKCNLQSLASTRAKTSLSSRPMLPASSPEKQFGLAHDDSFQRDDLLEVSSEFLGHVAHTIISLCETAERTTAQSPYTWFEQGRSGELDGALH